MSVLQKMPGTLFYVYFWHQTFIILALDISILALDKPVNNSSIIHQILPFSIYLIFVIVKLAKKLLSNPLLPHFWKNGAKLFLKNLGHHAY